MCLETKEIKKKKGELRQEVTNMTNDPNKPCTQKVHSIYAYYPRKWATCGHQHRGLFVLLRTEVDETHILIMQTIAEVIGP